MPISDSERLQLFERLSHVLGTDEAGYLMELLPDTGPDRPATTGDLRNLGIELRGEIAELRGEVRGEIAELRGEVRQQGASLELRMAQQTRTLVFLMVGLVMPVWVSLLI
jgi:hypothetical protein